MCCKIFHDFILIEGTILGNLLIGRIPIIFHRLYLAQKEENLFRPYRVNNCTIVPCQMI